MIESVKARQQTRPDKELQQTTYIELKPELRQNFTGF